MLCNNYKPVHNYVLNALVAVRRVQIISTAIKIINHIL